MRYVDMFPGTYLKASDLDAGPRVVTIKAVTIEDIGDDKHKPCLQFHESQQGIVLNKTNGNTLAEAFGGETDAWIGQRVELFAERTQYQGKSTMGIRLRPAAAAPAPPGYQPAQPAQGYPPQPAQPAQGYPPQPAQPAPTYQPAQPAQGYPPQPAQPAQPQPVPPGTEPWNQ